MRTWCTRSKIGISLALFVCTLLQPIGLLPAFANQSDQPVEPAKLLVLHSQHPGFLVDFISQGIINAARKMGDEK